MKLIILNGPTGVGKSTLAKNLIEQIPHSVFIDVDELRRTVPGYPEKKEETQRLAYEKTAELIENYLREDKNVIIDKTIHKAEVLEQFIAIAKKRSADVFEFLVFADKDTVQKRANERGYKPNGLLTPEKVGEHWEKMNELRDQRTNLILLDTTNLTPREVLGVVLTKIN